MMLKEFKMDLHIHTCLSPCAQSDMLPTAITKQAKHKNLDVIGVCDHNSAENVSAVRKAGEREGVQVLGGMEISSSEEVHVLAFFDDDDALLEMQNIVYENLSGENDEHYFGEQLIVDEQDRIVGSTKKLLIGSTSLGIDGLVELVHSLGGLAIASHIDRHSFSIITQLGFVPRGLPLDALELSWMCELSEVNNYETYGLPLVKSSDAHFLSDIGKAVTRFFLRVPSFLEVAMAFRGVEGRAVNV
jgi:PHP family Zn ribbon phosphoesterase